MSTYGRRPGGMSKDEVIDLWVSRAWPEGDCLIATCYAPSGHYPKISIKGRPHGLHQLVLERKLGRVLEAGEQSRHLCHEKRCINPEHLALGTAHENMMDNRQREDYTLIKLTPEQVRDIRSRYAPRIVTQQQLAAEYGVNERHIRKILRGDKWGQLSEE